MQEKNKALVKNKKLRDMRKKHGITQDAIAEFLGMTRSAYQHLETKGNPSGDILYKLSRFFSCEIEELIEDSELKLSFHEPDNKSNITHILLSDEEKKLLQMFDSLSAENKARVIGYLTGLTSSL